MKTATALALLVLFALTGLAPALSTNGSQDDVERLDDWPELARDQRDAVRTDVQRLRKARTPEMAAEGHAGLALVGAAAAPELLKALGKEKDAEARARLGLALDAITGAQHTRCIARSFDDRSGHVRVWALRRAAELPDPGIREPAERALERAQGEALKALERGRPVDPREVYPAALAATSAGSLAGLDGLHAEARARWKEEGALLRRVVEEVRGPEATAQLAGYLSSDREDTVAALRLLGGCGATQSAVPLVRPFLDSEDNTLRVAAINALRGIVDGEPPLDKLPVFEAIERAGKWKRRVG